MLVKLSVQLKSIRKTGGIMRIWSRGRKRDGRGMVVMVKMVRRRRAVLNLSCMQVEMNGLDVYTGQ